MINNNQHVGFDDQNRAVVSYHKYDASGNTQIYNARFESGRWVSYQVTNWDYRWNIVNQGGSFPFEISLSEVKTDLNGNLVQDFSHIVYGSGRWTLDPTTLQPIDTQTGPFSGQEYEAFNGVKSDFPEMKTRWTTDLGSPGLTDDQNTVALWRMDGRINHNNPPTLPWHTPDDDSANPGRDNDLSMGAQSNPFVPGLQGNAAEFDGTYRFISDKEWVDADTLQIDLDFNPDILNAAG